MKLDDFDKIRAIVAVGEGATVEFKKSTGQLDRGMETLCAFLNGEGGAVFFGVTDEGKINGQEVSDRTRQTIAEAFADFEPPITPEICYVSLPDSEKIVITVTVEGDGARRPFFFKGRPYRRMESSTSTMPHEMVEEMMLCRVHNRNDWSAVIVPEATIKDLDPRAIQLAREGYKQQHPKFADECDSWSDGVFLDKASLTIGGKITRATLLLVGKKESAFLLPHISQIVWKCFQDDEIFGDIYTIPYILATTELLGRIRNYRFKIYPKNSLIPAEVWKYDTESILEGMHNAIAHQFFEANERIIVTEDKDKLLFQNAGSFFDGKVEDYIEGKCTPTCYRNPALVKAMVNIKMIDSQGYGIHKMYLSQRKRYLPMPDYLLSTDRHVILRVPGMVINENYSLILLENSNLALTDAVLLDQVQKGVRITPEAVARLRKMQLIEGRLPNIFVSKPISHTTDQKIEYTKHKGLDTKSCEALLLQALNDHGSLTRREIDRLLIPVLSDQLDESRKVERIKYLLKGLRKEGKISPEGRGPSSVWRLGNS